MGCVAAHRGIKGRPRRGMDPHNVAQGDGEQPVRVVFTEVGAGHERQRRQIGRRFDGGGIDPVAPQSMLVKGHAAKGAVQRALQPFELPLGPLLKVAGLHGSFPPLVKRLVILAQVGALDFHVVEQLPGRTIEDHLSVFHHVGAIGDLQRGPGILLHQQNR